MPQRSSLVVATAGHIDHGKSSLVRALTGTETDRLLEEKRRGISIDLGFAHLTLADGLTVSFVDVPGHENFVKNMLAGVSGVRAALLIVAANEGVKPQTIEHFQICQLLGINEGLIVITKADLATTEQITAVSDQVTEHCRGTVFSRRAPAVVSAHTGLGLAALRQELQAMAEKEARLSEKSVTRLPVDRSFAMRGFGTVVTGTLLSGTIRVGDLLRVYPGGLETRVRGLQRHGQAVKQVQAGERAAANLTGVDHLQIARGMQLASPGELDTSAFVDAELRWLDDKNLPVRRQQYLLHAGTAEYVAELKLLDKSGSWARLWLSEPGLLLPGDRFILRQPSPAGTVGGGIVLDSFPPRRLNRKALVDRLRLLQADSWPRRLQLWVGESEGGRRISDLMKRSGLTQTQLESAIQQNPDLIQLESTGRVFSRTWLEEQKQKALAWLTQFHSQHPELPGAPLALARLQMDAALARVVFQQMNQIRLRGDMVALITHRVIVKSDQSEAMLRIELLFRQAGYQPPSAGEALQQLGNVNRDKPLLESLIRSNRLVRLSEDIVIHPEVLQHLRTSLAAHKGRRFSVPEFKAWIQISRKYAIPILEYLDRQHVTRRDGDSRVVL